MGKYVTLVTVATGVITVTYGNSANANITGATLILTPTANLGSVSWACTAGNILVNKWLPAACRSAAP